MFFYASDCKEKSQAEENHVWEDFYQKTKGPAPRQLLLDALTYFHDEPVHDRRFAIDLGCGDGTETIVLLERGWDVLAIDGEPSAILQLLSKVPEEARSHLRTQVMKFEDVHLEPADLIHASFSLPFCPPEHFERFRTKVGSPIRPDGRFTGQFFGIRDSWANEPGMTFHTQEQVRRMFEHLEIVQFQEMDEDGSSSSGPKHWHVFTVIARKKS